MKNTVFSRVKLLLAATFVLASVCVATGCLPQNADTSTNPCAIPEKLLGTWTASNTDKDVYTLTGTTFSNAYDGTTNFTINVVDFVKITDEARPNLEAYYLYCQADKDYTGSMEWEGVTYPIEYYHKDMYTAVYLEIKENGMVISCASNATSYEKENASLDYVKSKFLDKENDGYFGTKIPYIKK